MRQLTSKYAVAGSIVKYDGTLIPDDEPVMLLRGRDRLCVPAVEHYLALREQRGLTDTARDMLVGDLNRIKQWQAVYPELTRWPQ